MVAMEQGAVLFGHSAWHGPRKQPYESVRWSLVWSVPSKLQQNEE